MSLTAAPATAGCAPAVTAAPATAGCAPAVRAQLRRLAAGLGTVDPLPLLGRLADRVLAHPAHRLAANTLEPGRLPVEYSFAESDPGLLRVVFDTLGAGFVGAAFGPRGPVEVKAYLPVPAGQPSLPLALAGLPVGARPLLLGLSVDPAGRLAGRHYLQCSDGLAVLDLEPLLGSLGLAHRLPDLALRAADVTGGRLVLPSRTVVLGIRTGGAGVEAEVKLELMGSALAPELRGGEPLAGIVAVLDPLAAPRFEPWYRLVGDPALGYTEVAVVSVGVSASRGSRVTVYLRSHPVPLP